MAEKWIYINSPDNASRYVLGTQGKNTIFCFGINPSTAIPEKLDNTLRRVESISKNNGYDSWIMFNVYPKRDTVFENLSAVINDEEHKKNIKTIIEILNDYQQINVWVAFGNHIYDRDYLSICLKDIYKSLPKERINWLATGINKSGAPKHPLYQKNNAQLQPFDMAVYIDSI